MNMRSVGKILPLVLPAVLIICASTPVIAFDLPASPSPENLTLTLTTDNQTYEKGQTVQISGTANDPENNPVTSGTAEVKLSCGEWSQRAEVQITEGSYSYSYPISFRDPDGTWTITVDATDELGNTGEKSENIVVSLPPNIFYLVQFWSPVKNAFYSRGQGISVSVQVTEAGAPVENASVGCRSPRGENIVLTEISAGRYSATHTPGWDDPTGEWCISVEGKKVVDNVMKVGGGYTIVKIKPAALRLELISPTKPEFGVGESVEVSVRVTYPDGAPLENGTVTMSTPSGLPITLKGGENGVHETTYVTSSGEIGGWDVQIIALDPNGNLGSVNRIFYIAPPAYLNPIPFLLAIIGISVAIAAVPFTRRRLRTLKLKAIEEEKKHIGKLREETEMKYFKEGSISREIYDLTVQELTRRMAEIEKESRKLREKKKKAGVATT